MGHRFRWRCSCDSLVTGCHARRRCPSPLWGLDRCLLHAQKFLSQYARKNWLPEPSIHLKFIPCQGTKPSIAIRVKVVACDRDQWFALWKQYSPKSRLGQPFRFYGASTNAETLLKNCIQIETGSEHLRNFFQVVWGWFAGVLSSLSKVMVLCIVTPLHCKRAWHEIVVGTRHVVGWEKEMNWLQTCGHTINTGSRHKLQHAWEPVSTPE